MNFSKRSFVFAEEEYFSIDDILATNERIPCKFEVGVHKLGFLDPSNGNSDLARGTKLEIPLWMAQALRSRRIISMDIPRDSEDISRILYHTFRHRFRKLMDTSQNSIEEDATALTANLDRTEIALFNLGHKSLLDLKNWQHRRSQKILTTDLVMNLKKRKRTLMDDTP
ncbi:DNA replication complex GINS protein PSF3 [Caerostris extrusa]|uniref:DNA replication complex GINS protein PSF3 n=1 Tax=Caerostris extrusa TaxID=172846 RepID=A0AAV4VWQ0_CAEEX|nr:DNA replication complex GINS protein PSF3 [Caerostris extrusa]